MAKVLAPDVFRQHFDNLGDVLNGGQIETYVAGTSTPATTWTDSTGSTAQENPIILNSAGREPGGIWITAGTAYKFILKDADGVTLDTVDNIVIGDAGGAAGDEIHVTFSFIGTPAAQGNMGTYPAPVAFTFPVNFAGSQGSVASLPGSDFIISVRKNGVEVGTVTIDSAGAFTFVTTGGATVAVETGDAITLIAPATIGTAADIGITLVGAV